MRWTAGALGLLAAAYGVVLLLDQGWDNLVAAVTWLVVGVVVHDGVVGPLAVLVGVAVAATSVRLRAPLAVALVLVGTVTATAVPVLGRFGARPDNATLLDRNYALGWALLATLGVLVVVVGALRAPRAGGPEDDVTHEPTEGAAP